MKDLPICRDRCVCFVVCEVCEHPGRHLETNAVKVKCTNLLERGMCPRASMTEE